MSNVHIEKSFDTIFKMGYGGGATAPPHGLCVGKITHGLRKLHDVQINIA